jgi:hypothetical protein
MSLAHRLHYASFVRRLATEDATMPQPGSSSRYLKVIRSVRLNVEALDFNGSFAALALF